MLNVKFSSVQGFVLLYFEDKVYLVNTIYNMSLFSLSKPPEKVTLEAYLLEQQEVAYFESGNNKKISSISAVLITQPLVTLSYNLGKYIFQYFDVSYSLAIKVLLLLIAMLITLASCRIYLKSSKNKIPSHFMSQNKRFSLRIYKPKDEIHKRNIFNEGLGFLFATALI
ncbi:hypothetical protein, partial [Lactococcus sp. DD01]|uniref:hypothetical protein n=1 Tax=Lactococcus sp. DD01 TaxID=1776443 RepID=UPI0007764B8A